MLDRPRPEARAAVAAILAALAQGHRDRDADALAACYAPDATIADLDPPLLRRGFDTAGTRRWLDGWGGPVEIEARDLIVDAAGDLAVARFVQHVRVVAQDGDAMAWWLRATLVLRDGPEGWRIVHAHHSVPFHMDGTLRAALDLEP
jgi:ketosteroid isomerase-like protein